MRILLTLSLILIYSNNSYSQWTKVSNTYPTTLLADTSGISCISFGGFSHNPVLYSHTLYSIDNNLFNPQSWITLGNSLNQLTPDLHYIYEAHMLTDSLYYFQLSQGDKLYKTSDKGQTYSSIDLPNYIFNSHNNIEFINDDLFVLNDGKVIYSILNDTIQDTLLYIGSNSGRLIQSSKVHKLSNKTFNISIWIYDFLSIPYLTQFQILEIDIQNLTSPTVKFNSTINLFDKLSFVDSLVAYARRNDTLYKSINGGNNWNYLSVLNFNPASYFPMEFLNDSLGFITGDLGKIYVTYDGGINWNLELVNENNTSMSEIEFINENKVGIRGGYSNPPFGYYYIKDFTTSTSEIQKENKNISIYPNPASYHLNLKGEDLINAFYTILNITGQEIQSGTLSLNSIYVGDLKQGVYILKVESDNAFYHSKFIKE